MRSFSPQRKSADGLTPAWQLHSHSAQERHLICCSARRTSSEAVLKYMDCDIRIKSPTYPIGSDLVIKHAIDDTILNLKTKIKHKLANELLTEASQKLIYSGHVLDDLKTLSELNVRLSIWYEICIHTLDSDQCDIPSCDASEHKACRDNEARA